MMARRSVLGVLAGSVVVLLSGCNPFGTSGSYRYRLTVEVQTVEGVRTGSGVREVSMTENFVLTAHERPYSGGETGEAVVVDLPSGPVFLLLCKADGQGQSIAFEVTNALNGRDPGTGQQLVATIGRLGRTDGIKAELPRQHWPMMVRFADINDPKSVEQVDPASIGVKRITVETTGDDVTTGIEKRLGWLSRQRGSLVKRDAGNVDSSPPLGVTLTEMAFSSEVGK